MYNIKIGEYLFFYAHENNTLFIKSMQLFDKVINQDIKEVCTQERIQNTNWQLKLITNVNVFTALLKNVSMGCLDSVIPKASENHQLS